MQDSILSMIGKIFLSVLAGGLVGLERETHGRAAGLRTHTLVCLGSTLFTIASVEMSITGSDPERIAAQIVTGVGFLGAGTIMRQGSFVIGLTSAASIWSIAAVGLAIGIGGRMALIGVLAAFVVFAVLHYLPKVEKLSSMGKRERAVTVRVYKTSNEIAKAREMLMPITSKVRVIDLNRIENNQTEIRLWVEVVSPDEESQMISILEASKWVVGFSVE